MSAFAYCDEITKAYGSVVALQRVSIALDAGVTAVVGPNGAGKSTLVDILCGLRQPTSGRVVVLGDNPRSGSVRQRIGLTSQASGLPPRLTVREMLSLLAAHYRMPVPVVRLIERLDLGEFADRRCGGLSGGQQRRVALAAALVGDPHLLFLDEPTTGLDLDSRDRIWTLVSELVADGRFIVLTTHDMAEAERLANAAIVLVAGRVANAGPIGEVCASVALHLVEFDLDGELPQPPRSAVGAQERFRLERDGGRISVYTSDPDAFVRWLVGIGAPFRDIAVARVGLTEAVRQASALHDAFSLATAAA